MGEISRPHEMWSDPGEDTLKVSLRERGIEDPDDFLQSALSLAHGVSHEMMGGKQEDAFVDAADLSKKDRDLQRAVQQAIGSIDPKKLSGNNPLDKAASLVNLLKTQFNNEEQMAKMAEDPSSFLQTMKELGEMQESMEHMEALDEFRKVTKDEQSESSPEPNGYPEDRMADMDPEDRELLMAISRISKLRSFTVGAITEKIPREGGSIIKPDYMRALEDVSKVDFIRYTDWDFTQNMLDHNYVVDDRQYDIITRKQVVCIAEDKSGSMNTMQKRALVKAVYYTVFQSVLKGDTIAYVCEFTHERTKYRKVESIEDVKTFMNGWKGGSGGWTDVEMLIRETQTAIQAGELDGHEIPADAQPQLVVVNDGQDTIDPVKTVAPVHAIVLFEDNEELKEVCEKSGGTYHSLTHPSYRRSHHHKWTI